MLSSTDISRLNKQWNRPSIVMEFGIYVYQVNDIVSSVKTQMNEMFGYDEAAKEFKEFYADKIYNAFIKVEESVNQCSNAAAKNSCHKPALGLCKKAFIADNQVA